MRVVVTSTYALDVVARATADVGQPEIIRKVRGLFALERHRRGRFSFFHVSSRCLRLSVSHESVVGEANELLPPLPLSSSCQNILFIFRTIVNPARPWLTTPLQLSAIFPHPPQFFVLASSERLLLNSLFTNINVNVSVYFVLPKRVCAVVSLIWCRRSE